MTSPSDIGRIGEKAVETWAAQAGMTANPSFHDERGWDVILQLPHDGDTANQGPLDRAPPEISCMIQIKTTMGVTHAVPIAISNWQRMCKEPIPWFVLAVHLDEDLQPTSAYLVHIDERWCERVLRRLRELGAEARSELHRRTIDITWSESDRFVDLHGRELRRLIRQYVTPDQREYVTRKIRWFDELGYEDHARRVAVTFQAEDKSAFWESMADLAIGLRSTFPGEWKARLLDVRFGIEGTLKEFGREAGDMEYRAHSQGSALLEVCVDGSCLAAVRCDIHRARSIFPFLPPEFDKIRLSSKHVSCVLHPIADGDRRGFAASFSFSMYRDVELRLDAVRDPIRFTRALAHNKEHPVTLRLSTAGGVSEFPPAEIAVLDSGTLDFIETMDRALGVFDACHMPPTTMLVLEDLEAQRQAIVFLASTLEGKVGRLEAPYRELVAPDSMFAATTECALYLPHQMIGCFIGMYGAVTTCEELPEAGAARVVVKEGNTIIEIVIASSEKDEPKLVVARATILRRLQEIGCIAIWDESMRPRA